MPVDSINIEAGAGQELIDAVIPNGGTNIAFAAEDRAPITRRVQVSPYDLKIKLVKEAIAGMEAPTSDSPEESDVADKLCELAGDYISLLSERERWLHGFDRDTEMPCPAFLVPPIETNVED